MISTISPRVLGRKPVPAVKVKARAQLVTVSGDVLGVESIEEGQTIDVRASNEFDDWRLTTPQFGLIFEK